jgi:hypothetical protein
VAAGAVAAAVMAANLQAIARTQFGGGGAVGTYSASPATGLPEGAQGQGGTQGSRQTTIIELRGDVFSREGVRRLIERINEETEDGGRIVLA